ncbi:MAG TPA: WD40 repeat domain-containing protein [Stellaceae bacterium]|nr:WD40 repeat domain-containing protein [Stellaceae bacterium]
MSFARAQLPPQCPFVGLRPFRYGERDVFFGRDEQIAKLEEMIAEKSLISVVGSSGSGKSSLIRAGLLPRLSAAGSGASERWNWVTMRPGDAPIRALAEALTRPNLETEGNPHDPVSEGRANRIEIALRESSFGVKAALAHVNIASPKIAILIDQFEEIFRFADLRAQLTTDALRANEQREEATSFVQLLLTASGDPEFPARIIITMRSDFIGDCARFHGLSAAVTDSQFLVPALTRDQRADVIRLPIAAVGGTIEPALVQRVLNDTNEDPDQLPVLQHAMMRTWRYAETRSASARPSLRLDDYTEIGGIDDAISNHANEILEALGEEYAVKRIFQALTETDALGRTIRRPQRLGELVAVVVPDGAGEDEKAQLKDTVTRVVEQFAHPSCSFLRLPEDRELDEAAMVDIGHEALIRRWDKLGAVNERNWVREEQEDGEELNDLIRVARLGHSLPPDQLLLKEEWWNRRRPNRFWASRHNRDGAERLRDAEMVLRRSRAEIEERERARRAAQNRRVAALVGGVLLVLAGILGFSFYMSKVEQETSARTSARYLAFFGTSTLLRGNATDALEIAYRSVESNKVPYSSEIEGLFYAGLQQLYEQMIFRTKGKFPAAIAFGPKKLFLFTHELSIWNSETGKAEIAHVPSSNLPPSFYDLKASPDGRYVLISDFRHSYLMDLGAGNPSKLELTTEQGTPAGNAVFSSDGKSVLSFGLRAPALVWRTETAGKPAAKPLLDLGKIEGKLERGATAAAFGSRHVAVSDTQGTIYIFDTADLFTPHPKPPAVLPTKLTARNGNIFALAFNPARPDQLLALAGGEAFLWSIDPHDIAGSRSTPLPNPDRQIFFRAGFSPDGKWVALRAVSGGASVWNLDDLDRLPIELKAPTGFGAVVFGPDDRLAVSDVNRRVWVFGIEPALRFGGGGAIAPREIAPASAADREGRPLAERLRLPAGRTAKIEAVSADRRWLAWAPQKGRLLLFDLRRSTAPVARFGNSMSQWSSVRFAAHPSRIVVKQVSRETQQWRYFETEEELLRFVREHLPIAGGTGRRIDPRSACPRDVGGIKLSEVNPALPELWGSCKS